MAPIVLSDKSLVLDDVVVVGEKSRPIIEQKAGKLVFNVENSINAQGSNAFEISSKRLGGSTEVLNANGLVNIGFQKKFLQDRAIVKLSMSDLFWTNHWDNVNRFGNFESVDYGSLESRMVRINFTYKFGGSDKRRTKSSNVDAELNRF